MNFILLNNCFLSNFLKYWIFYTYCFNNKPNFFRNKNDFITFLLSLKVSCIRNFKIKSNFNILLFKIMIKIHLESI